MSVTCVLVPFGETEAEELLEPGSGDPLKGLADRARRLRRRVGRVDAVREDLHVLLFQHWNHEAARAPGPLAQVWRFVTRRGPDVREIAGYDPFVHLFGRSLPVGGSTARVVAEAITQALAEDDAAFDTRLAADLRALDPRAAQAYLEAPVPSIDDLASALAAQAARVAGALHGSPPDLRTAFDALVRMQAWSRPVWRLDGAQLPDLLSEIGVAIEPGSGADFFTNALSDPPSDAALAALPRALEDFSGPGAFLDAARVKVLAGALRLQRGRIRQNAALADDRAAVVLRHVRLVEEAALYCEANDLGLCEAAGVEWHDRIR